MFASRAAVHQDGVVGFGDGTQSVDGFEAFEGLTPGLDPGKADFGLEVEKIVMSGARKRSFKSATVGSPTASDWYARLEW